MNLDEDKIAAMVADNIAAKLLSDSKFAERIEALLVARAGEAYMAQIKTTVETKADAIVSACLTERLGPSLSRIDRAVENIVVDATAKARKHAEQLDADIALQVRGARLDADKITTAFRKAIRDEVHRTLGSSIDRFSAKWAQATLDEVKP